MPDADWNPAEIYDSYRFADNLPRRGLVVDGRPALSGLDAERVARYVLITVRDPLCAYDEDPAEQIARRLQDPEESAARGCFTTCSGRTRGFPSRSSPAAAARPEAELIMHELLGVHPADTSSVVGGSGGIHPRVRAGIWSSRQALYATRE